MTTLHFHRLLRSCKNLKQVKQVHALLTTTGLLRLHYRLLGQLFTSATSHSCNLHYATLLFSLLPHPTVFFYNTLIKLHSRTSTPLCSIPIYAQILRADLLPDIYTFPLLLKACTQVPAYPQGCLIHGQAIKFALASYVYVNNALIHFYSVAGHAGDARKLFETSEDLDVVSWNSMISAYARVGDVQAAQSMFDEMPERNEISWTALIAGYVQCGLSKEALGVFSKMRVEPVKPNEVTLVNVLSACAHVGALELGKWVHGCVEGNGMEMSVHLGTALMNMYAKCGEVDLALEVFYGMREKNLLAWTTMIKGLGMHGRGEEAVKFLSDMEKEGVKPDDIAFVGVLCACTHAGLVHEGRRIFDSMSRDYGIAPKIEHYGCMVDLLARDGLLNEARELVESMPMKPDTYIWGALMAGCGFQRNVEMAEYAVNHLIELEPDNSGVYVLLSNIYAVAGRQEDARKVRDLMESKGVSKTAGCSLIEVGGNVHEFIAGDTANPLIREIYNSEMGGNLQVA